MLPFLTSHIRAKHSQQTFSMHFMLSLIPTPNRLFSPSIGNWTQGLVHTQQSVYHRSTSHVWPFPIIFFMLLYSYFFFFILLHPVPFSSLYNIHPIPFILCWVATLVAPLNLYGCRGYYRSVLQDALTHENSTWSHPTALGTFP